MVQDSSESAKGGVDVTQRTPVAISYGKCVRIGYNKPKHCGNRYEITVKLKRGNCTNEAMFISDLPLTLWRHSSYFFSLCKQLLGNVLVC